MSGLVALPALRDLPPIWDGQRVDWRPWTDVKTTTAFHMPADQRACHQCGVIDEPLRSTGVLAPRPGETFPVDRLRRTKSGHEYIKTRHEPAWPIIGLSAARCRHCGHDTVTDERGGTTWDLGPEDYGPSGSTNPTTRKDQS